VGSEGCLCSLQSLDSSLQYRDLVALVCTLHLQKSGEFIERIVNLLPALPFTIVLLFASFYFESSSRLLASSLAARSSSLLVRRSGNIRRAGAVFDQMTKSFG